MNKLPMICRSGTGPQNAFLRRLRIEGAVEGLFVTDPPEGVDVSIADMLVRSKQVLKFEEDHDLLRRVSGGTGSASPHACDGMTKAFLFRIHEHGIPTERTIRHHVDDLWKMLIELKKDEKD